MKETWHKIIFRIIEKILLTRIVNASNYTKYVSLSNQRYKLITIALLIAVSVYCHLIEYRAKQKHLLPFHVTNNGLSYILII